MFSGLNAQPLIVIIDEGDAQAFKIFDLSQGFELLINFKLNIPD